MAGNAFTTATSLGSSVRQDYGTPRAFLTAVERCWGPIVLDLAAHEKNHVCPRWFGPGGEQPDSLAVDWIETWAVTSVFRPFRAPVGLFWLNPEYSRMAPWVKKCHKLADAGGRVALLGPANIGANWFWDHVLPAAHTLILTPRIAFDGAPVRGKLGAGFGMTDYELADAAGYVVGKLKSGSASIDPRYFELAGIPIPANWKPLPFPGPLMLALYGCGDVGRISRWAWRELGSSEPEQAAA